MLPVTRGAPPIAAAVLTLFTACARTPPPPVPVTRDAGANSAWSVAYPASLADLVANSDLIVEGNVVSAAYLGLSRGYDDHDILQFGTPPPGTRGPRPRPVSQHTVRILKVYFDASGAHEVSDPVTVRQVGEYRPDFDPCDDYERDQPEAFGAPGQRYLYFLRAEPDGAAYILAKGDASRLDVFGDVVRDSSCERNPILFASTDPSRFMKDLEDALSPP